MSTTVITGAQRIHHCDHGSTACPPLRSWQPSMSTTVITGAQHVNHCDHGSPAYLPLRSWQPSVSTTAIMGAQCVHHCYHGSPACPLLWSQEPSMSTTVIWLLQALVFFLTNQVQPGSQQICNQYVSTGTCQKMWAFSKQRPCLASLKQYDSVKVSTRRNSWSSEQKKKVIFQILRVNTSEVGWESLPKTFAMSDRR